MYLSQKARVLRHLEKHKTITSMECYKKLDIVDLQSAIRSLRKEGYSITDKWITKKNIFGRNVHYKKYKLEG